LGLPSDYGLAGCRAYDDGLPKYGCAQNEAGYCLNPWCYVDMSLCPFDRGMCLAAGGAQGSTDSPHCRTRVHNPTTDPTIPDNVSFFYSYETCGYINAYDTTALAEPIAGNQIVAGAAAWAPWVISTPDAVTGKDVWGGPTYDFFIEALKVFQPYPVVNITGWATQASMDKFPESSYTACVHDVAVGNYDTCIADLWLTPSRNQLVTFLPAIRQDFMYLVVPVELRDVSFWSRIQRPFLPFSLGAWIGVAGFLCIMSFLLWLRNFFETGCEGDFKTVLRTNVVVFVRSLFFVWHDFLLGQSSMDVETGPVRQLFSLGLAFFILITLASYTASLASMLVVERGAVGTLSSIEDAIAREVPICAPSALLPIFAELYKKGTFVPVDISQSARKLHAGSCGAMILSQDVIDMLLGGKVREADCEQVAQGSITAEEGRCETDHLGVERNDCNFIRVGDLLWSVPLSFPISERLAHSVSFAVTRGLTQGMMKDAQVANSNLFPKSICEEEAVASPDGLTFEDLSGSMLIAFAFVAAGFLVMAVRHIRRHHIKSDEAAEVEDKEQGQAADGQITDVSSVPPVEVAPTGTDPATSVSIFDIDARGEAIIQKHM